MIGSRRNSLLIMGLVALLVGASAFAVNKRDTSLGLDLAGGIELVYQAIPDGGTKIAAKDLQTTIDLIRKRTDALGVAEAEIQAAGTDQISVALPSITDPDRARQQIGSTAQLFFYEWEPNVVVGPGRTSGRLDAEGASNRPYDTLLTAVKLASRQSPRNEANDSIKRDRYYAFNRDGDSLGGAEVSRQELLQSEALQGLKPAEYTVYRIPRGTVVVEQPRDAPSKLARDEYFVLKDNFALRGDVIKNPKPIIDPQGGGPAVSFDFNSLGSKQFETVTKRIRRAGEDELVLGGNQDAASHRFAIVLDGEIVSLASISNTDPDLADGIKGGAQITGLSLQQSRDLSQQLEIGALPVSLKLISQTQVSATLGKQALNEGLIAAAAGLLIVLLFLLMFYRVLGVIAGLALLFYALIFMALIELIPITLTLPGIAGLVLTLSVAADANIVIFERIKEEVRAGRSIPASIATGYRKGFHTIADANVVTFLTAFILFAVATAGIKGFAFALGVGTLVSIFTAVVATAAILGSMAGAKVLRRRSALGAGEAKRRITFDFMGRSRWFFSFSGLILVIGSLAIAGSGLHLGIDFESGTRITAAFNKPATESQIRQSLVQFGQENAEVQRITDNPDLGPNAFQISSGTIDPSSIDKIDQAFEARFDVRGSGNDRQFSNKSVGPTFGASIARTATYALIFSLLVIGGYIALRFSRKFSVPVMIALAHDILITLGVYSLMGREVTSSTVAAMLTILGFSLYDTIIVFDRVRENIPRMPRAAFTQIVNRSMSEVLTRSLVTSLVTVLPVLSLMLFGGETLRDFAFALLVGTISGTYSSIFIAAPVLTLWKEREPGFAQRRERIEGENDGVVPAYFDDKTPRPAVQQRIAPATAPVPFAATATAEKSVEPAVAGRPDSKAARRAARARRQHGRPR